MNKQHKKVRRMQAAMWAAVIVVQLCTVTKMKVSAAELDQEYGFARESVGSEEMFRPEGLPDGGFADLRRNPAAVDPGEPEGPDGDQAGMEQSAALEPDSLAGGSLLQEDGSLIVKSPAVLDQKLLAKPEESRKEPDGRSWRLARWETVPVRFPGRQEKIQRTEEYLQIEDPSKLPKHMEVSAEWDGQTVTVDCESVQQQRTGEAWVDGFWLPVTFHGYHADYYELGDLKIPHNEEEPQLAGSEAILLEMAGFSPSVRRIETIVWDGPAYTAEDGELRRDALAAGQKLLADYQVTYTGTAVFPERSGWQTVAVYKPVPSRVTVAETTAPSPPETVIEDTPVPLWQKITRTLLVTVGAGSILAAAGLIVFGIFCLVKRRRVWYTVTERKNSPGQRGIFSHKEKRP